MGVIAEMKINPAEEFEHLPNAPIIEAVIEIRARSTAQLEEREVRSKVERGLADYAFLDSRREFRHEVRITPTEAPKQELQDLGWKGLRFQSTDKKHIAQFNRDGFAFSWLSPYDTWKRLFDESLRLWRLYESIAHPKEIQRIGLRFINRIGLPDLRLEEYICPAPSPPGGLGLPHLAFLYQDKLAVPEYPYAVNIIRTTQPPSEREAHDLYFILDIDVFTIEEFILDETLLQKRLPEMRWLKNKVFFGSITERTLKGLR